MLHRCAALPDQRTASHKRQSWTLCRPNGWNSTVRDFRTLLRIVRAVPTPIPSCTITTQKTSWTAPWTVLARQKWIAAAGSEPFGVEYFLSSLRYTQCRHSISVRIGPTGSFSPLQLLVHSDRFTVSCKEHGRLDWLRRCGPLL
jgi:hypothetical protein